MTKAELFGFIINNIWYILSFIVATIPLYIWFYKNQKKKIDFNKQEEISKKNLYLNRIDIIENKVYIIIAIIIALIIAFINLF